MKSLEFLTESLQISLAKKAYASLSPAAKHAIDSWEAVNWTGGELEQHVKANDEVAQEIEAAFKPVRDSIPDETVMLYRGYVPSEAHTAWKDKTLESWTADRRVAEHFAGLRNRQDSKNTSLYDVATPVQIEQAVKKYDQTGYVKFRGNYYVRSKENPEFYNIYDRHKQHITDGDDIRADFESDADWGNQVNAAKLEKANILEKPIDKDRIIWITNNLGSKEYIVRVR